MAIEVIDERSLRTDLLSPGGWVLDAGARGYVFTREMLRRGMNVVCVDPEPPSGGAINGAQHHVAVLVASGKMGLASFATCSDWERSHLTSVPSPVPADSIVSELPAVDVDALMFQHAIRDWDCVKMNIEGAEYEILAKWPGPIAKQIAVSFHDHTGANPGGEATYAALLEHLAKWYDVARHVWEQRYGAGFSYWDTLLVRR